jgi:DNA modification methylase
VERDVVLCGDAALVLKDIPTASCDALLTDPPAGIAFMGKDWDRPQAFPLRDRGPLRGVPGNSQQTAHAHERGFANGMHIDSGRRARDTFIAGLAEIFAECRRVIKPGGYALVWALPRTSHWTALALEEAGWEIRDEISHLKGSSRYLHLFGSGFPKSKSCLKPAHETWWCAQNPLSMPDLHAIISMRIGELEEGLWQSVTNLQADTLQSQPTAERTSLNIVSSWRSTWDGLCEAMSTSTIEMASSLITDLKTLNSSLSQITPDSIIQAVSGHDGQRSLVCAVDSLLIAASLKWSAIQTLSAPRSAIAQAGSLGATDSTSQRAANGREGVSSDGPAHEIWWLAKAPGPLQPLQIDACRVPTGEGAWTRTVSATSSFAAEERPWKERLTEGATVSGSGAGRWPPNTLLSHTERCVPQGTRRVRGSKPVPQPVFPNGKDDRTFGQSAGRNGERSIQLADADGYEEVPAYSCDPSCPIRLLDEQAGPRTSTGGTAMIRRTATWGGQGMYTAGRQQVSASAGGYGDEGGPSRYFPTFAPDPEDAVPWMYCPKASRAERNRGLDGMPCPDQTTRNLIASEWIEDARHPDGGYPRNPSPPRQNSHPCVKPLTLMCWLARLVCAPGGTILDPFCGSGSTLVACVREQMHFIGIDAQESYVEIARRRVAYEQEQQTGPLFAAANQEAGV